MVGKFRRLPSAFIAVLLAAAMAHAAPQAVGGELDLTSWNFQRDGIVTLDGEWQFYGNAFIPPDPRPDPGPSPEPTVITVPGSWRGQPDLQGSPMGADGFATYRLRILLPASVASPEAPSSDELAIFIPYAHTAYELWVEGEKLAANGVIGRSRSESEPLFLPTVARFHPTDPDLEVVLHVSNFHFREGGLPHRLELGGVDQILTRQRWREVTDGTLLGASLIMALFFAGVYLLQRNRAADGLFSLFLVTIALRMLITGDHLLGRLTGGLPWELELTLEYLTAYAAPALFLYYIRALFPDDVAGWAARAWTVLAAAGAAAAIVLPGRLSSLLIPPYMLIVLVLLLYVVYVGFRATLLGRPDARVFLGGVLASVLATMITLLRYAGMAPVADLIPAGVTVLVLSQVVVLALRWARTYRDTITLAAENARMLNTTRQQVKKLREYGRLVTMREENVRRQIAEMLHGRTQGRLFFIVRLIDQAERAMKEDVEAARGYLTAARNLLDQVRDEDIRSTSRRLHPSAVGAGLVPAVESLLSTFDESYEVYFDVDPAVETRDQSADGFRYDLRLGVYRILEEGLNNIARHAQASGIRLGLALVQQDGEEFLELTLSDNGVGFDPDGQANGLGLQAIDARVGDLGGQWKLAGSPGQGTSLWVCLPVKPELEASDEQEAPEEPLDQHESGEDETDGRPGEVGRETVSGV